jgi:protein ImuB
VRLQRGKSWRCAVRPEGGLSGAGTPESASAGPQVVVERIKGALRLCAVDRLAAERGLGVGDALADARARVPEISVHEADVEADAALLAAVADWCDRYTPLVALNPPDGLYLDISGCAHLFASAEEIDGERVLVDDLLLRLRAQGFAVRAGLADTVGAAWAAARFGGRPGMQGGIIIPPGEHRAFLVDLPLAALRLEAETVAAMERVGLKRVGDIIGRPRAPLAARFGLTLMRRLDQALGAGDEPISPRLPAPELVVERRFAEPIGREDDIRATLVSLAGTLADALEKRSLGARALELALFRVDGAVKRIAVGTGKPLRAPDLVLGLFAEKLKTAGDALDAGFGFDLIRLAVLAAQRDDPTQIDIGGQAERDADLAHLVDRLGARLGLEAVTRFLPCDTHLPEHRAEPVPAALAREEALMWIGEARPSEDAPLTRPLRLLSHAEPIETVAGVPEGPPVRFRWRKASYQVAGVEGPERLCAEWWRTGPDTPTRDYFRVEDSEGRRFWLYREGLYGRETTNPRWYLHGLFS